MSQETTTQTVELEQRITQLEAKNQQLEARMDALSKKLDRALGDEGDGIGNQTDTSEFDPTLNSRQREILNWFDQTSDVGDDYSVSALRTAVKANSDVSRPKTVKTYVKTLTKSVHFEQTGSQTWTYTGLVGE